MINNLKRLLAAACLLVFSFTSFSQDQCSPVGWATQNGGTTGGGSASATVVSNYSGLKTAITSSSVKVVHISGVITIPSGGRISFQDQTGKTIIGLPGSKLVSTDLTKDNSGILYVKRCTNIIFRNITFEGPGAYDTDGWDNMTLDASTNIWIDHCEFQDGMDGNLDVKNVSDYISITWCKFIYNKAPIPNGPGGSDDHRFTNLFGSSDGATGDRGHLRVTLQNNWWAQGCRERMPRVRFGKVHLVNNLFNSAVSNKCIMAGFEADLLVESNVFENVHTPIDLMSNTFTAITARNNIFTNTSGNTAGSGTSFTPPYSLVIAPAANVKAAVSNATCGAGATMTSPTGCGCGTAPTTYILTTSANPAAGGTVSGAGTYNSGAIATVTATPAAGYTFSSWSGSASGTSANTSVIMNSNKSVTANFAAAANLLTIAFNTVATTSFMQPPNVSAVISDPTDPARTKGIVVDVKDNGVAIPAANYTIAGSSNKTSVVPNASIVFTKSDGQANIKITPAGVGYATLTITLTKGSFTKTITINYAASAAAATPSQTTWPTGISDASAAIALDDNYFVAGDDELNNLYVHSRKESGLPLTSYNYAANLGLPDGVAEEVDLEAAVRSMSTSGKVYWIGSMGNGKSPNFSSKPNRNRIFATNISGTGAATSFSFVGYYGTLKEKMIAWGDANGYNFTASAAAGHDAKVIDGFNVEGLTFGPDNTTLFIGMRAPLVPVANRTKAVIAPIVNFETWFNNGTPTGNPTFGSPIELNLGGRGIRDLVRLSNGMYIIVAGSSDDTQNSALYKWTGNGADGPVALSSFNTTGLNAESVMGINEANVLSLTKLQVISDNGSAIFYADAIEAKDLTQNNFKKYRSDVLPGDLSTPVTYTLSTIASPAAGGTITKSPNASAYNSGTTVTLTATPAAGYTFTNWSDDASGTNATTTVTMSSNKSVTANFQAIQTTYTLTTSASPAAGGTISGSGTYNSTTVVTLTAVPATGYTFTNWSGDVSGTNATTTVTMSSNKSVTANFQAIQTTYTLATSANPAAGGTVTGSGIYNAGTTVTVTATPAAGYTFTSWIGDASGTNATTTVTMSANRNITANFQAAVGGTSTIRIEDNATPSTGLCLFEGAVSSNSGASNTKVINLTNSIGKGVNWRVNVPAEGSYTLNWRYANSSTSNTYSMKLIVNSVTVNAALPFPKTSGSSVFLNSIVTVNLTAGNNDIRLESIASNATADIDWIEITGNSPAAGNCNAARGILPAYVSASPFSSQKAGVHPNPAKGKVTIGFDLPETDKISIQIFQANGVLADNLGSKLFTSGYQQVVYDLSGKKPGLYTVVIIGERGIKQVFKMIVQ